MNDTNSTPTTDEATLPAAPENTTSAAHGPEDEDDEEETDEETEIEPGSEDAAS